jgi:hypothetical protein
MPFGSYRAACLCRSGQGLEIGYNPLLLASACCFCLPPGSALEVLVLLASRRYISESRGARVNAPNARLRHEMHPHVSGLAHNAVVGTRRLSHVLSQRPVRASWT